MPLKRFIGLIVVSILAGCSADAEPKTFVEDGFQGAIADVEDVIQKEDKIKNTQIVAAADMVLVTYEVKPWYRVQKQKIEKSLKKKLEKKNSELQFVVSGDFKMHYEAKRLAKEQGDVKDEEKKDIEDEYFQQQKSDKHKNKSSKKSEVQKAIEDLKELSEEET